MVAAIEQISMSLKVSSHMLVSSNAIPDHSWQKALAKQITDPQELLRRLDLDPMMLGDSDENMQRAGANFKTKVSEHFLSLMKKGDPNDPLLRQVLPTAQELHRHPAAKTDPLEEQTLERDGNILQKYNSRILITANSVCPVHCRYCFRRHYDYPSSATEETIKTIETYANRDDRISEVVFSGGDPLLCSDKQLARYIGALEELPTIKTVRFHTRTPITIPERMTSQLLSLLSATSLNVVIVTHSNHANEISTEFVQAMRPFRQHATLLNQSVLLRGINDSVTDLYTLSCALFNAGILPYYIHLFDRVQGAMHFDVPQVQAESLLAELRAVASGYLVPKLVKEEPGALSKTAIA